MITTAAGRGCRESSNLATHALQVLAQDDGCAGVGPHRCDTAAGREQERATQRDGLVQFVQCTIDAEVPVTLALCRKRAYRGPIDQPSHGALGAELASTDSCGLPTRTRPIPC